MAMFEGFETADVDVGATTIWSRWGGMGLPLRVLHGFPETHVTWRSVAPQLAEQFTVVYADLRGYGSSGTPPSTPDHAPYAKRAMAADMVTLMERLGFDQFSVLGHDRGGRVAYRLALDHAERVDRPVVLDVVQPVKRWTGQTVGWRLVTDHGRVRTSWHLADMGSRRRGRPACRRALLPRAESRGHARRAVRVPRALTAPSCATFARRP